MKGSYTHVPIETVTASKKLVDIEKYYDSGQLRPYFKDFEGLPLLIMASD